MDNTNESCWKRKILSCIIVAAFFGSIYVFSPNNASAVMVNITGLAEGYDQGTQIEIIADVYIEDGERIPIDYVALDIAGPMFVNTSYEVNGTPISSPPWVSITLLSIQGQDPGYGYGYGSYDDYYNYDYGYRYGYDYDDGYTYDFGYGYGYIGRLKYRITIDSSFLMIGNYTMQLHVITGSMIHQQFSSDVRPFAVWPVGESGNSWPQFQNNPAHTGYSTSEAPGYDYLIWTRYTEYCYQEHSPVISDGKVIISIPEQEKLLCMDEETGYPIWEYICRASPVPAISNGRVYFTSRWLDSTNFTWKGQVQCLDLHNGSIIWSSLTQSSGYILKSSVTIADGRLFVSSPDDYHVYCLAESSGDVLWTSPWYWHLSTHAPLIYQSNVYFTDRMGYGVVCLDECTGIQKWSEWYYTNSPISAENGAIYFTSGNNWFYCLNTTTGARIWQTPIQNTDGQSSVAFAYGYVYVSTSYYDDQVSSYRVKLSCFYQSNGTLNWLYAPQQYSYSCYASPAVADGKVYIGLYNIGLCCFDAFNGSINWIDTYTTNYETGLGTPAIANGKVFVASLYHVLCFGLDKYVPEHSNEYPPISGKTSSPTPTITVDVTDQSGIVEGTIRMKVDGISVFFDKSSIFEGFRISYTPPTPYIDGQGVTVQIIADDVYANELDFTWWFIVDLIPPEVVSHSPDGTDIPTGTDIWVEFSEEMDKWSTENAFWFHPYESGSFNWSGNTMIFTPDTLLQYNTEYTVYLDRWSARDIAGNKLISDYSWNFTTEIPELDPPEHSNEFPSISGYTTDPKPTISVWVTDTSGVDESSIRLYINGVPVFYNLQPVTDGFNVSYYCEAGLESYSTVDCRIVADDIYGNHLDFTWTFFVNSTTYFEISLQQGWNLISVPLIPYNNSIEAVLSSINGKWDCAQSYDGSNPMDPWKTHNVYAPASVNDLNTISNKIALWLHITDVGVTLNVTGGVPVWTSIILKAGWNLVGYPTLNNTMTIGEALAGTGYDNVEGCNLSMPYNLQTLSDTYVMQPGEGYWVHVPSDTVWVIDWEYVEIIPLPPPPVGAFNFVAATSNSSAMLNFGTFTPIPLCTDLIVVLEGGGDTIEMSWPTNPTISPYPMTVELNGIPTGAITADYWDLALNDYIDPGDYITVNGIQPSTTYTVRVFSIPSNAYCPLVGEPVQFTTPP